MRVENALLHRAREAALNKYDADELETRAIEEAVDAALTVVIDDLHRTLYPEKHPRFDHVFWHDIPEDESPCGMIFQWSSETIGWVTAPIERMWEELHGEKRTDDD